MIPKVIHYCWFGGNPLKPLALECIESWKKFCPDYEIKQWNESNFDVNCIPYTREAYAAKKWAFVSDYARLWALVNFGGIYMDTDCELVKPIDTFLHLESMSGFESATGIPTAIMGSRPQHPLFVELLGRYHKRRFVKADGSFDLTTNVAEITETCLAHGLVLNNQKQTICGFTLFPRDWFCPKCPISHKMVAFSENTHAIHHFDASWRSPLRKMLTLSAFRRVWAMLPQSLKNLIKRTMER